MKTHVLLTVADASGAGAEVEIFVAEMEKAGWQVVPRLNLAFTHA